MALRSLTSLNLRTAKAMAPIERITLFKIPNEADRDRVLEQYKVLAKTATKVQMIPDPVCVLRLSLTTYFGEHCWAGISGPRSGY